MGLQQCPQDLVFLCPSTLSLFTTIYFLLVKRSLTVSNTAEKTILHFDPLAGVGKIWPEDQINSRTFYGLNICIPPKFICWNGLPLVLGGEAFGRCLGHEGETFMKGISAYKRDPRELSCLLTYVRIQQENNCLHHGIGLYQNLTMLANWSWTWSFQNCEK